MWKTEYFLRPAAWASLLMALALVVAGCTQASPTPTPEAAAKVETIKVSLLVLAADDDPRWFRDVELPRGTDAWELTEAVAGGQVESQYYPLYRSHFVDSLFGVKGQNPRFWLVFLWSEASSKWEPLPVGADLFSLKDGHVLAWYYADTSKGESLPPITP
ncbi:MAG: hypothetical protein HY680_02990 [Chloroflexi bacterium]|nr:hypothetical protein [Chloroflexota bacterium]